MERDTGRSRGFGFVTFEDAENADKAVAELNGSELMAEASESTGCERPNRGGGRGGRGGGRY